MTKIYNIQMDEEQLPIVQMLIEKFIYKEKESIQFFYEKLNGAGSTKDVKDWTDAIRSGKSNVNNLNKVLKQMLTNEPTIKHNLYEN